jgi:hypothetical protein
MACPEMMAQWQLTDLKTPELRACYEQYRGWALTPEELAIATDNANQKQTTPKVAASTNDPWWNSLISVASTGADVYTQQQLITATKNAKLTGKPVTVPVDAHLVAQAKQPISKYWIIGGAVVVLAVFAMIAFAPKRKS